RQHAGRSLAEHRRHRADGTDAHARGSHRPAAVAERQHRRFDELARGAMNSQGHWTPACVVIATALIALPCSLSAQDFSALDPAAGKALFERNWVPAPASTAASDGLGPYYNARSCEACHPKGGAGAIDINRMSLLTRDAVYGEMLQLRAVTGLPAETSAGLD